MLNQSRADLGIPNRINLTCLRCAPPRLSLSSLRAERTTFLMFRPRPKRRAALLACAALLAMLPLCATTAFAQLRGHGGPVRALAISPDGQSAVSGSFDTSAIRWSLTRNTAEQVLRFHNDAVNAVDLAQGTAASVTAGADARIAIWTAGTKPDQILEGHTAPIVALAVSPDGETLASASWDHTVRLWPLAGGAPHVLEGSFAKRQRRRIHAGRPRNRQRQLRSHRAHLAARQSGIANHRHFANAAQRRCCPAANGETWAGGGGWQGLFPQHDEGVRYAAKCRPGRRR